MQIDIYCLKKHAACMISFLKPAFLKPGQWGPFIFMVRGVVAVMEHGIKKQIDNTKTAKNAPCGSPSALPLCSEITRVISNTGKARKSRFEVILRAQILTNMKIVMEHLRNWQETLYSKSDNSK